MATGELLSLESDGFRSPLRYDVWLTTNIREIAGPEDRKSQEIPHFSKRFLKGSLSVVRYFIASLFLFDHGKLICQVENKISRCPVQ